MLHPADDEPITQIEQDTAPPFNPVTWRPDPGIREYPPVPHAKHPHDIDREGDLLTERLLTAYEARQRARRQWWAKVLGDVVFSVALAAAAFCLLYGWSETVRRWVWEVMQ